MLIKYNFVYLNLITTWKDISSTYKTQLFIISVKYFLRSHFSTVSCTKFNTQQIIFFSRISLFPSHDKQQ